MKTNSIRSDKTSNVARFTVATGSRHGPLKCKTLLLLALPLTLALGCVSGYSQSTIDHQASASTPDSERRAANIVVGHEIFEMFMADNRIKSMSASVDNGVVTLHGVLPNKAEQQRINDQMLALAGVNHVQDDLGDVAPTPVIAAAN